MDTSSQPNHLTALPPELLHIIISYLYPSHYPDKAWDSWDYSTKKSRSASPRCHTLDYLAATCRTLRAEVMDWAESFMRQHKDIMKYKKPATKSKGKQRDWLNGRGGLLWWSERNCVFCGKTSVRTAIFMNGLDCCKACDEIQWPDKITKTAAKEEYHLKDHHLLPHLERTPISAKMLAKHPGGVPKLRYGTCISINGPTTLFSRQDVEVLAQYVHGDLKSHLAKRQEEREERKRKKEEAERAARQQEARRLAHALPRLCSTFSAAQALPGSSVAQPLVIDDDDDMWMSDDLPPGGRANRGSQASFVVSAIRSRAAELQEMM